MNRFVIKSSKGYYSMSKFQWISEFAPECVVDGDYQADSLMSRLATDEPKKLPYVDGKIEGDEPPAPPTRAQLYEQHIKELRAHSGTFVCIKTERGYFSFKNGHFTRNLSEDNVTPLTDSLEASQAEARASLSMQHVDVRVLSDMELRKINLNGNYSNVFFHEGKYYTSDGKAVKKLSTKCYLTEEELKELELKFPKGVATQRAS